MTQDYDKQAADFMEKTGLQITKQYAGHRPYFDDEKEFRAVWVITMTLRGRSYSFNFGQSIVDSYTCKDSRYMYQKSNVPIQKVSNVRGYKEALERGGGEFQLYKLVQSQTPPTDYDILASIEKNDPGTFDDFCSNYGYDTDSRKAEKVYFAVQKQASEVRMLFSGSELEALAEIQ